MDVWDGLPLEKYLLFLVRCMNPTLDFFVNFVLHFFFFQGTEPVPYVRTFAFQMPDQAGIIAAHLNWFIESVKEVLEESEGLATQRFVSFRGSGPTAGPSRPHADDADTDDDQPDQDKGKGKGKGKGTGQDKGKGKRNDTKMPHSTRSKENQFDEKKNANIVIEQFRAGPKADQLMYYLEQEGKRMESIITGSDVSSVESETYLLCK